MLEALFDDGQYVERQEGKSYGALGFIYGHPMLVGYALGGARMTITSEAVAPNFIESLIRERLNDEQIEVEVKHSYADEFGGSPILERDILLHPRLCRRELPTERIN